MRPLSDRLEFSSLSERVWLIYTLYVLHECQLTRPKYAIPLPEGEREGARDSAHARLSRRVAAMSTSPGSLDHC
jgi:hypothetical protein